MNAAVGIVAVVDPDAGSSVHYQITGGNVGNAFQINEDTGAIAVTQQANLDFETRTQYQLAIRATDNGGLVDTCTATINLIDVDESPTVSDATFAVMENSPNGTFVGQVQAHDPEGHQLHYYFLANDYGGVFEIGELTGAIRVADSSKLNYESRTSYSFTIEVSCDNTEVVSGQITITVGNVAEAPAFVNHTYTKFLVPNMKIGEVVAETHALDGDGDTLTYSFSGNSNAGGLFAIDANTGKITLAVNANTLPAVQYLLDVQVSDGTLTDLAVLTVDCPADVVGVTGDGYAVEGEADTLTLRFMRFAKLNAPLTAVTVSYAINWSVHPSYLRGSAASLSDLTDSADKTDFMDGSVDIDANKIEKVIVLKALPDQNIEGIQTFWIKLTGAGSATIVNGTEGNGEKKQAVEVSDKMICYLLDGLTLRAKDNPNPDGQDSWDVNDSANSANPGFHENDVTQGGLGDCYFNAALAAAVRRNWGIISNLLTDNGNGSFTARLFDFGDLNHDGQKVWTSFTYDGNVLARGGDAAGLSGDYDPITGNVEIWVNLLEKAWADLHGNWSDIEAGTVSDVWPYLIGLVNSEPTPGATVVDVTGETGNAILDRIKTALEEGKQVVISTPDLFANGKTEYPISISNSIIHANHAYPVVGLKYGPPVNGTAPIIGVRLYNPWGYEESIDLWVPTEHLGNVVESICIVGFPVF